MLYQRFIGRTAVRPYTRNLDQPILEADSDVRPKTLDYQRLIGGFRDCPQTLPTQETWVSRL